MKYRNWENYIAPMDLVILDRATLPSKPLVALLNMFFF